MLLRKRTEAQGFDIQIARQQSETSQRCETILSPNADELEYNSLCKSNDFVHIKKNLVLRDSVVFFVYRLCTLRSRVFLMFTNQTCRVC